MGALFSGAEFLLIAGIPAAAWAISVRRACRSPSRKIAAERQYYCLFLYPLRGECE
jgi:hypothetical protein